MLYTVSDQTRPPLLKSYIVQHFTPHLYTLHVISKLFEMFIKNSKTQPISSSSSTSTTGSYQLYILPREDCPTPPRYRSVSHCEAARATLHYSLDSLSRLYVRVYTLRALKNYCLGRNLLSHAESASLVASSLN